jgi:ribosomal protein L11 methyltransferase
MTDDATAGPWLELTVEVAAIDSEIAADLLRQACTGGVVIEQPSRLDRATDEYVPDADKPALVKGYVRPDEDVEGIHRSLEVVLQLAPLQQPAVWHEPRHLAEEDWREAWKKYFGVNRIGKRLVIVPSWVDFAPKPDDVVIRIDPGMAFGTGQHPTTAMCLDKIEELVCSGVSVLDLGCGSGILAIAAAKLGAGRVLALDIDPQAVKAARENAATNNVEIDVREGTLEQTEERFDVIAANISGLTLERLAPRLHDSLKAGGLLIASGFLEDTVDGLRKAFEAAGLRIHRVIEEGIWRAIIAERLH